MPVSEPPPGPPAGARVSRALRRWWRSGVEALGALAFPMECPICGAGTEGNASSPFCEDCRAEIVGASGVVCGRCALPVGPWEGLDKGCSACRKRSLGFDAAVALGPYQDQGPIRQLCLMLKHDRHGWIAPWLGRLLVDARPELRAEAARSVKNGLGAIVVPVPLHWRRLWKRRYNQSEELARGLARRLGLPEANVLRRVAWTPVLARVGRAERSRLLKNAFKARASRSGLVRGRTVFLVDDVLTTGATTGEAARELKRAGAARVVTVVVGRTGGGPERMTEMTRIPDTVRIGTRGSPLARWQAEWVAGRLREAHPGLTVVLVEIKTQGDRDRNTPLAQIGGLGLFTKEIQRALLEGSVDLAVHSLKDLPTQGPPGLVLGAIPPREDPADALIAPKFRTLDALPDGASVGTGSLRRRAQLLHLRPGLSVVGVRGNVETRLNQALGGALDAVVLAESGLRRLGLEGHVTERLGPPRFLPAPGQGALGLECRASDLNTLRSLAPLDDPPSRRAVVAERQALAELEGGCMVPLGAWGRDTEGGLLALDAAVFDPDGRSHAFATGTGPRDDPEGLGRLVADSLRRQGAEGLLRRK